MSMKQTLTGLFAAVAATLALACLPPAAANAADVGFCATPQKMTEVLKAEGQRTLSFGNQRILIEELPDGRNIAVDKEIGLFFTASKPESNGFSRVGYVIQADKPVGTPATKMCVADRMHDVKLYDAREPGLPEETLIKSTPEAAAKQCEKLAKADVISRSSCGFHNDMLKKVSALGERIMLQGLGVKKQDDGTYTPNGAVITITANMTGDKTSRDGRGGIQYSFLPGGASFLARVFTGTGYTQTALNELPARNSSDIAKKSAPPDNSTPAQPPAKMDMKPS
ncbi:MAG: hypothetical protein HY370_01240 [Proteobacteria bacterium]|nr:hypothetical protein [Pseudomonadota bacterium]